MRFLRNEEGSALVMVLVVAIVFGILGTSLLYLSLTHHQHLIQDELKSQSYYAAETGVMNGIKKWKESKTAFSIANKSWYEGDIKFSYQVDFAQNEDRTYTMISKGMAKKSDALYQSTTLTVRLNQESIPDELNGVDLFNYTIFSGTHRSGSHDMFLGTEQMGQGSHSIELKNEVTVYGDLYAHRFYLYTEDNRLKFYNTKLVTYPKDEREYSN